MYKLLAKILANRLKMDLLLIISTYPCHGAFVAGRQIFDGVLTANEIQERLLRKISILLSWILLTSCYSNLVLERSGVVGF